MDKSVLSHVNKSQVLNTIREKNPIFRAEISRLTDLSIPTVMKITEGFISKGLVVEGETAKSSSGKPPKLLRFVDNYKYIIGIDIGTTNITTILVNLAADIIVSYQEPTDRDKGFNKITSQVIKSINYIIENSNVDFSSILGIGIGMPGLISPKDHKISLSPDLGWKDKDLLSEIKTNFNLPVRIDNVTRSMAMGELYFGYGHDIKDFVCINLGYGIGSAIVMDGKLYYGSTGASGELGHIAVVNEGGPQCSCGNYGCLEALASANAIASKAKYAILNGAFSTISSITNNNLDKIDAKIVFEAAGAGDILANSIIHETISYLGMAVGSVINFLDPSLIILEGGVSQAGSALLDPLFVEVSKHIFPGKEIRIVVSKLGKYAASIGASTLLLNELINNGGELDQEE